MQKEQRTVTKKPTKESKTQKGCLRQKGRSLEMKTGGAGVEVFSSLTTTPPTPNTYTCCPLLRF